MLFFLILVRNSVHLVNHSMLYLPVGLHFHFHLHPIPLELFGVFHLYIRKKVTQDKTKMDKTPQLKNRKIMLCNSRSSNINSWDSRTSLHCLFNNTHGTYVVQKTTFLHEKKGKSTKLNKDYNTQPLLQSSHSWVSFQPKRTIKLLFQSSPLLRETLLLRLWEDP